MTSEIRDINLWESGELKIEWVRRHMPVLAIIEEEFRREQPFKGLRVALSVHLEAKTAHLCEVLAAGGAEMYVTGSNPLSTQDDVAAALAHEGLKVFALHGASDEEYFRGIRKVIESAPHIIIDDGGDLVNMIHGSYPQLIPGVIGGCEETTTGIHRLKAMDRAGELSFPMMLVNDAACKHLFDNRYGTGQSVWDGIDRTTNLIVAGKTVVVAGYGWCGKGVAMRAKGLGAKVVVTEIDPVKAMEAVMDGFTVMEMDRACSVGDIFVTVTGCADVIGKRHFPKMQDGAILCNAGHFDVEVDVAGLRNMATSSGKARENIMAYTLGNGRTLYVIGEGRLVNLAAGDGHPAEIMDMSFAVQALSARYLVANRDSMTREKGRMLFNVPGEIDDKIARLKLRDWGVGIDSLTPEQHRYLYGQQQG
ncbi:MAG: adenosylhomocysteinase [Candidatus Cryptobacteroides sp.]